MVHLLEDFGYSGLDAEDVAIDIADCVGMCDEETDQLYYDMINMNIDPWISKLKKYVDDGKLTKDKLHKFFAYFDLDDSGNPIEYDLNESIDTPSDKSLDSYMNYPNFDITIHLPYYEGDEYMEDHTIVVKAKDGDEAEKIAKKYIRDKKTSKNAVAWKDARIVSIYER